MKISLCMVVRNAGETLDSIFEATKDVVDELCIFDQDSDDDTKEICEKWGAYYHWTTRKNLADIDRQKCYNIATGDAVFVLDDDEMPDVKLLTYLARLKKEETLPFDVYWIKFKNLVDGVDIHSILGDDWHPRLWVRGDDRPPAIIWPEKAHTYPTINTHHVLFCMRGVIEHRRSLKKIRRVTQERAVAIDGGNREREMQFLFAVERLVAAKRGRKIVEEEPIVEVELTSE